MQTDQITYSSNDDEAAARATTYEQNDPFPSIPRALLSSVEIDDYARVTGMLFPFFPKALKSASYEAHIGGSAIWWDEKGKRIERTVKRGEQLVLEANSIVFVQVEPTFRLPDYMAIRFNLRITHVHRGLLLGTGPLVDPGFHGKLLIPLHNLTSSPYNLNTNDALIWIEFTKTTFGAARTEDQPADLKKFVGFPPNKRNMTPDDYLRKANGGNPIRSSIPDAVGDARRSAKSAERWSKTIAGIGFAGFVALVVALYAVYLQVGSMIQNSTALTASVQQMLLPVAADTKAGSEKIAAGQSQMDRMNQQLDQLSRTMETKLTDRAAAAQAQIDRLTQQTDRLNQDLDVIKKSKPPRRSSPKRARPAAVR
ncbi:hypothetical protein KMZ29_01265 [Bradyrhizobium sediminis]|uniref:Deoxycytidine triphosphate deaminase n=1 Tax=Bradyrhizobium sediminis TaxID=2840469 RepID=A0A975RMG8_9BRAD|nr:hypothetical protein [Bradyrhizobium sediminis]QWG13410.1 hypothetical protein KMZ29_01265 [Bradyrhizobium sediminis]